ncbi:flagellin [Phaeovulum sp.]|uniref:flagellin n=1 Tax=Phaeovulum sp. TaxID=2934796 RepID=UPI002730BEB9|nr:flagellin [Phaeovulum sp.]MDP1668984.1 flagellin [Phaeovulum sp.]
MSFLSIGDMAQLFQLRQHNAGLKSLATTLTAELTSGQKHDTGTAVRGDFTALAGVERSLTTLAAYATATAEAGQLAATQQVALAAIGTMLAEAGPTLLSAATSSSPTMVSATTADARQKLRAVIAALNTNTAGRYAFAGDATDTRPLAPAEALLGAIGTAVAAETTASGIIAALDAWFDAPAGVGGFLDTAYGGGAPLAPFAVASGESVELGTTAAAPEVRNMLKGLALAALVAQGALAGDAAGRAALTRAAGERVMTATGSVTALAARIGSAEAGVADAATRNTAEGAALEMARAGMTAADPYDTATALQAVQAQLETLYTLTARLSNLKLTDYLR